jgi:hypothetical protein
MLTFCALSCVGCASTSAPNLGSSNAPPTEQVYVCKSRMTVEGYPFGKTVDRKTSLTLVLNNDPKLIKIGEMDPSLAGVDERAAVATLAPHMLPFCFPSSWQGRHCTVIKNDTTPVTYHLDCVPAEWHPTVCKSALSEGTLHVTFFNEGNMTGKNLDLNTKTGSLSYGGGGIDGGYSFTGVCKRWHS